MRHKSNIDEMKSVVNANWIRPLIHPTIAINFRQKQDRSVGRRVLEWFGSRRIPWTNLINHFYTNLMMHLSFTHLNCKAKSLRS